VWHAAALDDVRWALAPIGAADVAANVEAATASCGGRSGLTQEADGYGTT